MLIWQVHNNTVMLLSSSANHNTASLQIKYHRKCGKVQQRIVIYLDSDKISCFVVTFSALHLNATVEHGVSSLHFKGHFSQTVRCWGGATQQRLFFVSNCEWKHKKLSIFWSLTLPLMQDRKADIVFWWADIALTHEGIWFLMRL